MAKPWHMQRLLNTSFSFSLCILWFPAVPCVLSVDPCNIGYVSKITQISSIIRGLYTWHSVNSMTTKFFRNPLGVNLIVSFTINLMPTVPIFKFLAVTIMVLGLIDMMYRFFENPLEYNPYSYFSVSNLELSRCHHYGCEIGSDWHDEQIAEKPFVC